MSKSDELDRVRRYGIVFGKHKTEKWRFSRQLRQNMTPAEALLWQQLRAGRLSGLHFRRQQIIDGFIVDFFCLSAGLVIEIDGSIHDERSDEDAAREEAVRFRNLRIVRFSHEQILNDMQSVLNTIKTHA